MTAVTSGAFKGGKTMDDYYPALKGTGAYSHPGTAGPFDTGTWVGANAQLIGTVNATCRSAGFTIAQTVKHTRFRANGFKVDQEGTTEDDIAAAGVDQSKPPFRQVWTGGGVMSISMADPPSIAYGTRQTPLKPPAGRPPSEVEWDREFVTSLAGPTGRKSVTWKTSIRVVNGKVTANTIA